MLHKYNASDYFYAEIHHISAAYEKYCKEVGIPLLFHSRDIYHTLLLKKGDTYIDLKNPYRNISLYREDNQHDYYVISWKYALTQYLNDLGVDYKEKLSPLRAINYVYQNSNFFVENSAYLGSKNYQAELPRAR